MSTIKYTVNPIQLHTGYSYTQVASINGLKQLMNTVGRGILAADIKKCN